MMRVYIINGNHEDHGLKNVGWVRTENQAKKVVKLLSELPYMSDVEYNSEDIPNDKGGLVGWLNGWSMDNPDTKKMIQDVMK